MFLQQASYTPSFGGLGLTEEALNGRRPRLDGKVAIVTGVGSSGSGVGTGKAISILLAGEGGMVLSLDVDQARAEETLATIRAALEAMTITSRSNPLLVASRNPVSASNDERGAWH